MLKALSVLVLTFLALPVGAHEASACTAWTKQNGVSCIFAGEAANLYKRQCENPCGGGSHNRGHRGLDCDQEVVCHPDNPENFNGACSEWTKVESVTCFDPNSQDWEQRWERACTNGLSESWCSRDIPFR